MNDKRKKYAVVGLGGRSSMFTWAILEKYKDSAELVGLCDLVQTRMDFWNERFTQKLNIKPIPTYRAHEFDTMIADKRPDVIIVTTMDRTHHTYIIRAMELGCDVITEKPMTVDAEKCQAIVDTVKRTGRKLRVTFNYRYSPHRTKVKELLTSGVIGKVNSVHFEWLLDTVHGADYFRRWHRDKRNSGGLMVHKSTHHFDLVNWWLDTTPKTVFGFGDLMFYGRENAEKRGITKFYDRGTGHPNAADCKFALNLEKDAGLKGLYLNAEHEDGYQRDQSVFGHGISVEDTMGVIVRYQSGAIMTYSLNAYMPWEGFRIAFNGTKGRIELDELEKSYVSATDGTINPATPKSSHRILVLPQWEKPYTVEAEVAVGGHGGGDVKLLEDLFGNPPPDPYKRAASHVDGAQSILTGIAANKAFASGLPVDVETLVKL